MIVISDRILRQAGLTLAEAKALMGAADGELVVHIRQCLDPISSCTIATANDLDCLNAPPVTQAEALNASFHRETAATPTDSRSVAPVEDHGYSLGTAAKLAAAHDMTLTYEGGLYTLTSAFGRQPYTSLAEAVAVIKQFARWREAVRQSIDQTRRL